MAHDRPPTTSFEQRLAEAHLPPPGPAYFHARRALWLAPGPHPPRPTTPSASHRKLAELFNEEGAEENDEYWKRGLYGVWKSLMSGARLRKPLPLRLVVKIALAGWIRDGTWPRGGVAPDPDDELEVADGFAGPAHPSLLSPTSPHPESTTASPWPSPDNAENVVVASGGTPSTEMENKHVGDSRQ